MYVVGNLHDPKPDDREKPFSSLYKASKYAELLANKDWNTVIAVWNENDDVVTIFTNGDQFDPA